MTTDSATQTPCAAAATEQPEVVYDTDPSFFGCSRFEWCVLRKQPRWRYVLHLLAAPFPGMFIVLMMAPPVVRHLFMAPDHVKQYSLDGVLISAGVYAMLLFGCTFFGARSNEREFAKLYDRASPRELDGARAYFALPQHLERPTFASQFRRRWHWSLLTLAMPVLALMIWGAGQVFAWSLLFVVCLPWILVGGDAVEWDEQLAKYGAYLAGPDAPANVRDANP